MPQRKWSFLMPAQDHFFIKRILTHLNAIFTDYGKILLCALFVGAAIGAPGLHITAYIFPCFIFTVMITSFAFSFFFRPQITVTRQLPPSPYAGEIMIYRVVVKNIGKRPIRKLTIIEGLLPFGLYASSIHEKIDNTLDILNPGESAGVRLVMHCKFRGLYQLSSMYAGSSFPSGILRLPMRIRQLDKFIVYPKFVSQTEFKIPFHRVYQPGGIAVSSNIGSSNEFLNTREYRHGDRLRDIHWASYARTGKLIVKEYVDEYFVRIALFLDTESSPAEEPHSFERRISVAAGIADAIARKEFIIDLFAVGENLYHFQAGRALAHLENLLELLACLESSKKINIPRIQTGLMKHVREISSIVMIFHDWDEERAQLCRALENLSISLRVIVVRDQPLTRPPDREIVVVSARQRDEIIH